MTYNEGEVTVIRMIRAMTVLAMTACGSAQAPLEQPPAALTLAPDAVNAAVNTTVDATPIAVDAAPVAESAVPIDAANLDDFYEDGVHVLRVDAPQWCSPGKDGHCAATEQECRDTWRGCAPATSWACFEIENSSLGSMCFATLATCQQMQMEKSAIFAGVGACTSMRLRGAIDTATPLAPDPDVFDEDGVQVMIVDKPRWCAHSGSLRGGCWRSAKECRRDAKDCRRATSWACFDSTSRTSGKTEEVCGVTYALCDKLREFIANDPEQASMSGCTIMRLRKGKK